jgi:hypothetical protein
LDRNQADNCRDNVTGKIGKQNKQYGMQNTGMMTSAITPILLFLESIRGQGQRFAAIDRLQAPIMRQQQDTSTRPIDQSIP